MLLKKLDSSSDYNVRDVYIIIWQTHNNEHKIH